MSVQEILKGQAREYDYPSNTKYVNTRDMDEVWNECNSLDLGKIKSRDVRLMFGVAYYHCLKMDEAVNVKKSDIDLDRNTIKVGNDEIPTPPFIQQALSDFVNDAKKADRYIIEPRPTASEVNKWLKVIGDRLNLDALSKSQTINRFDVFRRSYAIRLCSYFHVDMEIIQELLRHERRSETVQFLCLPDIMDTTPQARLVKMYDYFEELLYNGAPPMALPELFYNEMG